MRSVGGRAGLSLIEVLVAITVLGVGLVGLAHGFGLTYLMIGQGRRFTEVASLAAARVETLRAGGCSRVDQGFEVRGRYSLSWTSARVGGRRARVSVSVTSPTAGARRVDRFVTDIGCDP